MKKSLALLLCGLLVGTGSARSFQRAAKRSHYADAYYGFSIDAPRFPANDAAVNIIPVVFTGPGRDGFASNVNVTVQRTKTTAEAYRELSIGQFKQLDFKVNAERTSKLSGRDAVEFDYQGKVQDRDLRFLSLAVIDTERVILVTCTATTEAFPAVEAEFRVCIASLRLAGEDL